MRKWALIAVLVLVVMAAGCASWERTVKDFRSEFSGGLERTVTVYSMTGDEIATYTGKIDVAVNDNKVKFELNGKRVIIYNAVVIVEEL